MSNRSRKRSLLTEQKVRRAIREEIDSTGISFTKKQKDILEEGLLDWISELIGSLRDMLSKASGPVTKELTSDVSEITKAFSSGDVDTVEGAVEKLEKTIEELKKKLEEMKKKSPPEGAPAAGAPATGAPATGAKPAIGQSKPIAINNGAASLQGSLFKLAGGDQEKKKQVIGVLKALGNDLKTGQIPINEAAAGLVNLKNTVAALTAITDPKFFKSVKDEIVKILNNVKTKVNIAQIQSARQTKTAKPAAPAAAAPAAAPAA